MSLNLEYLWTRPGILKIIIVVFGIIAVSSGSEAFYDSNYNEIYEEVQRNETFAAKYQDLPNLKKEVYFIVATFFCLSASFIYLLALGLIPEISESDLNRYIDTSYHIIASLLIFIAGFLMFYSAADIKSNGCPKFAADAEDLPHATRKRSFGAFYTSIFGSDDECQLMEEKIVAGIFAQLNGVLYAVTATVIFRTKLEDLP